MLAIITLHHISVAVNDYRHAMNPSVKKSMKKRETANISGQELQFLCGHGYRKNVVSIN